MKKISLFTLLLFTFLLTTAQNKTLKRTILWEDPKSISHYFDINQKHLNKTNFLSFDKANYIDNNLLPYYYELIHIGSSNVKLQIANVSYKTLTNNELKSIKNNNLIREQLQYSYTISSKRNKPHIQLNLLPLRKNSISGLIEKVISFDIQLTQVTSVQKVEKVKKFVNESVLNSGKWVKLNIQDDGIYKLTYNEIVSLGFSNPENIKIYGNHSGILPISNTDPTPDDLIQNAIYFEKGSDGIFNSGDYVLFFAKGPNQWKYDESNDFYYCKKHIYSDFNYIFLSDIGAVKNISNNSTPVGIPDVTISSFIDYAHHEKENENLIESGQLWLGEHFDITTNYNFDFSFSNIIESTPVKIRTSLVARSGSSSSFTIKTGSTTIANPSLGSVNLSSYTSTYAVQSITNSSFNASSDNINIEITYNKPSSSSEGWLDYITLNAERELKIIADYLRFSYYNITGSDQIIDLRISNANTSTQIWDVTDPTNAININSTSIGGTTISVKTIAKPGLNNFVAYNSNYNFRSAEFVNNVTNQNLHSLNHKDLIIVSHPDFLSQANEIAEIHETKDNLSTVIVTPEQIYNEFSSGTPDASAIRNFVKMIYNRPSVTDTLKYLLLIGDGSYDNKSTKSDNTNFILTYQSENSLTPTASFVTDDFYGLLDNTDNVEASNSGLVDIGIGRFPVSTNLQAQQIVNKIQTYISPNNKGDWLNSICFVGDDEDNNIHMRDADKLASFVDTVYPHYTLSKIYLDAYPQESSASAESYPEVTRLINDQINNGILIFNYTGHGGENGLTHERVLSISDINSWVNSDKLAIFVTATCEFSRFDNPQFTSAGELVLLNPNGGSIALFSTTRLVYSSPNYVLNRNFFDYVFEKDYRGETRALGDIIRLAKNASGTANNKRNFTLLGDPALKIPIAEFNINTDSVNHKNAQTVTDTLKALSKVTIHGHVANGSKSIVSDYNGIIYPIVFDKSKTITTLANDGGNTMNFDVQNNILYKGKASVTNGKFNFSFVVPKDISYNFDSGKISYYSTSSDRDAKGSFNNFIIGGSDQNAETDEMGPDLNLYLNDESFVSGGITNENPKLYAILSDSSGINTVGNGIGHDITVTLDENTNNLILLNDYYQSDIDDYQKGKIEYLFDELEEGEHSLKLKVWDVYNNSTEKELEFTVAESAELAIKNVINYPNPFTENTSFYFDHNRINEDLDVLIQIFTISGKIIKTITTTINSQGFRSEPIPWNGLDDFGDKIGRGVYIYIVKVRTPDGETVSKTEKLVILK